MRKIFFFLIFLVFILVTRYASALEVQCFTDYASFSSDSDSVVVSTTTNSDDLFFTQDGIVVPSRQKDIVEKVQYPYTLNSNVVFDSINRLTDDIPGTSIEIQPTQAIDGISLTLDFPVSMQKDTFVPYIDIDYMGEMRVEISTDSQRYVPVSLVSLSAYDFSSLRISFPKSSEKLSSYIFRTIRFDKKQGNVYILSIKNNIPVQVYAGWICDRKKLSVLTASRDIFGKDINIGIPVLKPFILDFAPLPTIGKDTDSDGVIDMRDNCSLISNRDQLDRNYDGIGDACSDDDGDTIYGMQDNCPTVKNREQKDLNNNKIGDACEFDSDNDTIMDGADNCIRIANPDQKDTDSDGIGDACDNCILYNPAQIDIDKSSIGDVCELVLKQDDEDSDGIADMDDNCTNIANPDQTDTDSDGIGDACDNCMSIKNTDQGDSNKNMIGDMCEDVDIDGIDGWRDNCPSVFNPDQGDADNDMIGNACIDTDIDSTYDDTDNCPLIYNPDQKDTDSDGIGDMCDPDDNRFIESNKIFFMALFGLISCFFIGGTLFFMRKITL